MTDYVRVSLKYRDREGQPTNPRREDANKIETACSLLNVKHEGLKKIHIYINSETPNQNLGKNQNALLY